MATSGLGNLFSVNSSSSSNSTAINVDVDGCTVISKLVLLDEKTGNKWQIKISDGEFNRTIRIGR